MWMHPDSQQEQSDLFLAFAEPFAEPLALLVVSSGVVRQELVFRDRLGMNVDATKEMVDC